MLSRLQLFERTVVEDEPGKWRVDESPKECKVEREAQQLLVGGGTMLDSLAESGAVVLHHRRVPNTQGNIDHLVIAPSGVWIVDAKKWEGRVERRWGGRPSERLLYVNGRNRMEAIENLDWQIQAVRAALTPIGFADAPNTGVLCFTGATWGMFAKPLRFRSALVTWPDKLVAEIAEGPPTDPATINLVAQQLSSKLPAIR